MTRGVIRGTTFRMVTASTVRFLFVVLRRVLRHVLSRVLREVLVTARSFTPMSVLMLSLV